MVAEAAVNDAGDDVFPAVLLHPVKAALPVDAAFHRLPRFQRLFAQVHHRFPPFPGVQYPNTAEIAGIRRLSPALGIKSRGIQHHLIALFRGGAAQNPCGKRRKVGIFIV